MADGFFNITLFDMNGEPVEFECMDMICYDDKDFVVLYPVVVKVPGEYMILEVKSDEDSGDVTYEGFEDEELLNAVFDLFKKRRPELL